LTELLLMVLAFVKMAFIGKGSHKPIADYDWRKFNQRDKPK
jgi:hypothetical protein